MSLGSTVAAIANIKSKIRKVLPEIKKLERKNREEAKKELQPAMLEVIRSRNAYFERFGWEPTNEELAWILGKRREAVKQLKIEIRKRIPGLDKLIKELKGELTDGQYKLYQAQRRFIQVFDWDPRDSELAAFMDSTEGAIREQRHKIRKANKVGQKEFPKRRKYKRFTKRTTKNKKIVSSINYRRD